LWTPQILLFKYGPHQKHFSTSNTSKTLFKSKHKKKKKKKKHTFQNTLPNIPRHVNHLGHPYHQAIASNSSDTNVYSRVLTFW